MSGKSLKSRSEKSQKVKFGYFDLLTLTLTFRGQTESVFSLKFFRNGPMKSHTKFGAFVHSVNILTLTDPTIIRFSLGRLAIDFYMNSRLFCYALEVRSGMGAYTKAARRRVHLATVLLRSPSEHSLGRRQARHVYIPQIRLDLTQP